MDIEEIRKSILPLLNNNLPYDAQEVYYAFHHPDDKTTLFTSSNDDGFVTGYTCLSRTGVDLFRPLVTMRLPISPVNGEVDFQQAAELLHQSMQPGMPVIISAPEEYFPLLASQFHISAEQELKRLVLKKDQFEPIVNVLVRQEESYNNLPRYVIRATHEGKEDQKSEIVASAGVNWQSPYFADIYVHTKNDYRRQGHGRSVVAALVRSVLETGQLPIYTVRGDNIASIELAQTIGFVDTGQKLMLIEGALKESIIYER